jgi:gamma-glutamyltranspeptidase
VTPLEVSQLLTMASAYDNRTVKPDTVMAWLAIVGDIPADVAAEALKLHFAESEKYLQPHHIVANARRVVDQRARALRVAEAIEPKPVQVADEEPELCKHNLWIVKCIPCCKEMAGVS